MNISKTKILYTNDYSIFKTQQGNRDLLVSDIKRVEKKILENNLLHYHPILVSKDYYVIDGQHRLEVAKRNNLDIYFVIMSDESSLKTTQSINTTGKPWTVKDFLKCYVSLEVESYIEFNEILRKYNFLTISQLIELGSSNRGSGRPIEFRDGLFKFANKPLLIKALEDISLYKATGIGIENRTHFQRFILACVKKGVVFNHNRMIDKIKINVDITKKLPSDHCIIADILGEIYNFKLRNKVNFNIRAIK